MLATHPPPYISRTYHALLDTLYPPTCVTCHAPGFWICPLCTSRIQLMPDPSCGVCHLPVDAGVPHGCPVNSASLIRICAVGAYDGPLRDAIHALKYHRQFGIAPTLADRLAKSISNYVHADDLLVRIPLHSGRRRERGFDQTHVLCRELSRRIDIRYEQGALRRIRPTRDQTQLHSAAERKDNLAGAFIANSSLVGGRSVWLLDDVCTTRSTVNAGALALKAAGAASVSAIVVARTTRH